MRLARVELIDASLSGQRFVLGFDVTNPNPVTLPVSAIDYTLDLAGQRFAQGKSLDSVRLPANGSGNFSLEVRTNLLKSARALSKLVMTGGQREIDYALNGSFSVDLPLAPALPFRQSGRVRIDR
ncbi:MAG: LEA type 2 family protein [Pseudomonadota bacterium]